MRQWQLKEPKTTHFSNPAKIVSLKFMDRLNTDYYVQEDEIDTVDFGVNPTYKDYLTRGLDPNNNSDKKLYGLAKSHKPLTTRINEMKESINNAGVKLNQYFAERDKALAESQTPAPQPEPIKEEVKNDK